MGCKADHCLPDIRGTRRLIIRHVFRLPRERREKRRKLNIISAFTLIISYNPAVFNFSLKKHHSFFEESCVRISHRRGNGTAGSFASKTDEVSDEDACPDRKQRVDH